MDLFTRPWLLHPLAVHFPVALLTTGLLAGGLTRWRRSPPWLPEAATWLLWLGTAGAWAALGLGLLAEETAPHVPPAWQVLATHERAAYWTAGTFTLLSLWRFFRRGEKRLDTPFLLLWLLAASMLAGTGWLGSRLAYEFGMGVGAPETTAAE